MNGAPHVGPGAEISGVSIAEILGGWGWALGGPKCPRMTSLGSWQLYHLFAFLLYTPQPHNDRAQQEARLFLPSFAYYSPPNILSPSTAMGGSYIRLMMNADPNCNSLLILNTLIWGNIWQSVLGQHFGGLCGDQRRPPPTPTKTTGLVYLIPCFLS